MTISKKKSRTITINGEIFRWGVSPGSGYLVFVAELEAIKGQRIEVYIESDIHDYWANFPYIESLNLRLIKPKVVRRMIIQAMSFGWDYKKSGKPIVFDLIEENLVKRPI